jgi:hypothetical protein
MKDWIRRTFHSWLAGFWELQIETARRERDWIAVDHAITRRDHHEAALLRVQGK